MVEILLKKDAEVLKAIEENDDPTLNDVSEITDTPYSYTRQLVDNLVEGGLVARSKSYNTRLTTTDKGKIAVKEINNIKEILGDED